MDKYTNKNHHIISLFIEKTWYTEQTNENLIKVFDILPSMRRSTATIRRLLLLLLSAVIRPIRCRTTVVRSLAAAFTAGTTFSRFSTNWTRIMLQKQQKIKTIFFKLKPLMANNLSPYDLYYCTGRGADSLTQSGRVLGSHIQLKHKVYGFSTVET